jgi:hypothetical protein
MGAYSPPLTYWTILIVSIEGCLPCSGAFLWRIHRIPPFLFRNKDSFMGDTPIHTLYCKHLFARARSYLNADFNRLQSPSSSISFVLLSSLTSQLLIYPSIYFVLLGNSYSNLFRCPIVICIHSGHPGIPVVNLQPKTRRPSATPKTPGLGHEAPHP